MDVEHRIARPDEPGVVVETPVRVVHDDQVTARAVGRVIKREQHGAGTTDHASGVDGRTVGGPVPRARTRVYRTDSDVPIWDSGWLPVDLLSRGEPAAAFTVGGDFRVVTEWQTVTEDQ